MYQSFIPLGRLKSEQVRIFDPFAYRVTQRARLVPAALDEVYGLAEFYPVVWVRNEIGQLEVFVLRGLHPDAPIASAPLLGLNALPLLLQAFPFRYQAYQSGDLEIGIERTAPERERDQGAYIYNADGEFLPGAELKMAALEAFIAGHGVLRDVTAALAQMQGFEKVGLPADLVDQHALPDMYAVRESIDLAALLDPLPASDRAGVMRFLTAQRLSLYRMGAVIQSSQTAPA